MGEKYIYTIANLTKKHGNRAVLSEIWLAFYPGAKIGVLGRNGAGKSTLLRIMAGQDTDFEGEARLTRGFTVEYLAQEPQLDSTTDVFGNVQLAVTEKRGLLDRFNEINARLSEPIEADEMEKLCDELASVQDRIDAENLWDLDRQLRGSRPESGPP